MLLSHHHKFIFLKTTKTAGTSVELLLEPLCVPPNSVVTEERGQQETEYGIVGRRATGKQEGEKWYNHMPAAEIKALLAPEIWESYTKIACVRNPYARIFSAFRFMHVKAGNEAHDNFEDEVAAFDAWLNVGKIMGYKHIVAIKGVVVVDKVLRHENLMPDLAALVSDLDLPVEPKTLPHSKKSAPKYARRPIADYYDAARRDQVMKLEGWAFEAFGYSEDPKEMGPTK